MSQSPNIHEVFIYLCVSNPEASIKFYQDMFDAEEIMRLTGPNNEIAHTKIKIGPATIMLSGEYPDHNIQSPKFYGGSPVRIHLHVDDVDSLAKQAEKAELLSLCNLRISLTENDNAECKIRLA